MSASGTGLGSGSGAGPWSGVGHGGAPLLRIEQEGEGSRAMASDEAGRRRRPQARELGLLDQEGAQELGRRGALLPGELRRGKGDPRACGAATTGARKKQRRPRALLRGWGCSGWGGTWATTRELVRLEIRGRILDRGRTRGGRRQQEWRHEEDGTSL